MLEKIKDILAIAVVYLPTAALFAAIVGQILTAVMLLLVSTGVFLVADKLHKNS